MATIGNKKATQLVELTATELQSNDLFYIVDSSAKESKKMQASQLALYLNYSGSIEALHAVNADTASFIFGSNVYGSVVSASWADKAGSTVSSSWASSSVNSILAITASYSLNGEIGNSQSASYLIYTGFPNGTVNLALTASTTVTCQTASFLQYIGPGNPNGTASYAITTQNVNHATTADTASYLDASIGTVPSASWAAHSVTSDIATNANSASNASNAINSTFSQTASFLRYTGVPNGTASYALVSALALASASGLIDYGIFSAITQSTSLSQLDVVSILDASGNSVSTNIEAVGTVIIPFTSSLPVNETLILKVLDIDYGTETTIETIPVYFHLSPTIGNWNSFDTGSVKMPYTLLNNASLYGRYLLFVTASSNKIQLDTSRTGKFKITSMAPGVSVATGNTIEFSVTNSALIQFSSSAGGPFYDIAYNMVHTTGSNEIYEMDFSSAVGTVPSINYAWKLSNFSTLKCVNKGLVFLSGFANSLLYLDISQNGLSSLPDLSDTVITRFDCNNNVLTIIPPLPLTPTYIDVSSNQITSLPSNLPGMTNLRTLYFNDTSMTSHINSFPNSIVSMSLHSNPSLTVFSPVSLPAALVSIDCHDSPIGSLPSIPLTASYINASNCSLDQNAMDDVVNDLVTNNLKSGSLNISGNGVPFGSTQTVISSTLIVGRAWSVAYDLV